MKTLIPGHFRASTLWIMLIAGLTAYAQTHRPSAAAGVALMFLGGFLVDQATHLAQMDHATRPPTWIERQLQNHRWLSSFLGVAIVLLGVLLAF